MGDACTCLDAEVLDLSTVRFPGKVINEFRFSLRAANGSEVLHSTQYSRKTASVLKYVDKSEPSGVAYGESKLFVSLGSDIYVVLQKLKTNLPTIILQVSEPENQILYSLCDDRLYGSFFHIVSKTDSNDCVHITDILCSAVLIEAANCLTVTDVLPFEHD